MIRSTVDRKALIGFGAALLMLLLSGMLAFSAARIFATTSDNIQHTYEVLAAVHSIESARDGASAANRTFIATGSGDDLLSRDRALSQLDTGLQNLRLLTRDNSAQQRRVDELQKLLATGAEAMDEAASVRAAQGASAAPALRGNGAAAANSAAISQVIGDIGREEHALMAQRVAEATRWRRLLPLSLVAAFGLAACLLGGLFLRIRRDVEERYRAGRQLGQNNRLLESLIDNIPDMIFLKNADTLTFARINKAGEELIGKTRAEMIGKSDRDFFPAHQADFFVAKDREVLVSRTVMNIPEETLATHAHGVRILHTRKIGIYDDLGAPAFLLGISEDITERRAAEQKIVALNDSLKDQAARLAAANQELESFAYSVSHDLRSPLRAIGGFSQMLEEDCGNQLSEEGRRYVSVIRDGSRRMATLIDDLLEFSRIGRQPMRRAAVDMGSLAREVIGEITAAGRDGVVVTVKPLPPAAGDPALLKQVWVNLIDNAVKYSAGRPEAKVDVDSEHSGTEVTYRVRDNGVGFDMRYYSKLFGVFQRLHSGDEFPGTGVGLAIVQRIIGRHGGRVWGESTPGKGATFSFSLPLAPVDA